ncbi:hypothetical protein ACWCPF_13695 [Streptomyces sp. NPDC001858]
MTTVAYARLIRELHGLLATCQDLAARHKAALDQYRDPDGTVRENAYAAYEDARTVTAIEAGDQLDTLVTQLTELVGPPPPRTFTLAFAGRERHDGEQPTSFAVHAASLHQARRVIEQLPGFRQWSRDDAPDANEGVTPDIVFLPRQSHPGLRAGGEYVDLRPEQTLSAPASTGHPVPAVIPPPATASLRGPRSRPR